MDFTKLLLGSFCNQWLYTCAIRILNYYSPLILTNVLQRWYFLVPHFFMWWFEYSKKGAVWDTRNTRPGAQRSKIYLRHLTGGHLDKSFNFARHLSFTIPKIWGNDVLQVMCGSALENAMSITTTYHATDMYWGIACFSLSTHSFNAHYSLWG